MNHLEIIESLCNLFTRLVELVRVVIVETGYEAEFDEILNEYEELTGDRV